MKAQIPDKHLPTKMAADNRLTTIYSTHVLIPKLGPIATQRYARQYARLLKDIAAAVELVLAAQAYAKTYEKPVAIPAPPPPAQGRNFSFKPVLDSGNQYMTSYMAGLMNFAAARHPGIARAIKAAASADQTPAPRARAAAAGQPLKARAAVRVAAGTLPLESNDVGKGRFEAEGVWPSEVVELLRDDPQFEIAPDGRLIIEPLGPRQYLASEALRERAQAWIKPGAKVVDAKTIGDEVSGAAAGEALAQILHGIAQPNAALEDLLAVGAINASGRWLGPQLQDTTDVPEKVAQALAERAGAVTKARRDAIGPLVAQALEQLLKLGVNGANLLHRLRQPSSLRDRLFGYTIWRVDQLGAIDPGLVPLPDDTVIVGSREWAFRRTERLSIGVGTPTLRGPFAAEAVAPASELVQSESSVQEVVSVREQGSERSRVRSSESTSFSAASFRQALAHMAEEGVNSEAAFTQQTTLFDSLRERRREAIERTLTQISSSNEQRTATVSRSVTSRSRSYTTRGKDAVHATTEISFQVAAPVDVQVRLEDVGLVWCPRLPSPFMALHRLIDDAEREARVEYIAQNFVSDPARPAESYESVTVHHEVGINGNQSPQVVAFVVPIPANCLDWTLDAAASKEDYRNGTAADYQEYDRWNWDDLENWRVAFTSIGRAGADVTGSVIFETTDTEVFNRGFITLDIVMKRLTEESRATIAAYELERLEAAAQRRAVEVRANQYARLRRDELIEQYEESLDLQEEGFSTLVRTVFQGGNRHHVSYWREILHSCIDWSAAGMRFEPAAMDAMAYPQLPPSHFMNAQGVRFILPVHRSAEGAFFDALEGGAGSYFKEAATKVRAFVDGYRKVVEEAKANEPEKLVLDSYASEIVLGRHLEAVLSEHPFAEPS